MHSPTRREFLNVVSASLASVFGPFTANAATLIRYPYVQNVRRTRATVRWTASARGAGSVEYLDPENNARRAEATVKVFAPEQTGQSTAWYRYEATLRDLSPGAAYRYRVSIDASPCISEMLQFRTPGTQPFRFLAFGDSGTLSSEQRQIARQLSGESADFALHTGDLAYPTGTYGRYETAYFEIYRDVMATLPFFPCPGNHDYYELRGLPYLDAHSVPDETVPTADTGRYYSFDWGNAHFTSLDSNECLEAAASGSGAMLEWLDKDLSETTKFWRIAMLHHSAYSAGIHADEVQCQMVRKWLTPVLEKHRVPLVLNGHEHSYQRSRPIRAAQVVEEGAGTVYVSTGGGGAPLHPVGVSDLLAVGKSEHHYLRGDVTGWELEMKAIALDLREIDRFVVAPAPVLSETAVVNSADYTPRIAGGSLVSVLGLQLAAEDGRSPGYPLPTRMNGVSVLLDGTPLPILTISARQICVQIPFDAVGNRSLVVKTPNGSAGTSVEITQVAPAIFPNGIFHDGGAPVSEANPLRAGEDLTLHVTGLGSLSPPVEAGTGAAALPVSALAEVAIDGQRRITPEFARSIEGTAGLYEVRFRLDGEIGDGVDIAVIADGVTSNPVRCPAVPYLLSAKAI